MSSINADNGVTSGITGIRTTADNTGNLALQSNGVTLLTLATNNTVTISGTTSQTGNASFGNVTASGIVTATGGFVVGASAAPAFSAYNTGNQNFTSTVSTKVTLSGEDFDTNSNFASSRFTPTVAGYYQFNGVVQVASGSSNITEAQVSISKNGATAINGTYIVGPNSTVTFSVCSGILYMNGSTDYVEMYGYGAGTSPYFRYLSSTNCCTFSGFLARSA